MLTLRPERFVAGGEALAKAADGRVVFVRGALPGELVTVELTEEKRDWSRGHVVEVIEPSVDRVDSAVPSIDSPGAVVATGSTSTCPPSSPPRRRSSPTRCAVRAG